MVKQVPVAAPSSKLTSDKNALVSHTRDGVDVPVLKAGSNEPVLLTDQSNVTYSPVTVEVDDSDGKMLIRIRKVYTRAR